MNINHQISIWEHRFRNPTDSFAQALTLKVLEGLYKQLMKEPHDSKPVEMSRYSLTKTLKEAILENRK